MASDRNRRRASIGLAREALEARHLLSALGPAWRSTEVRGLDRAQPSPGGPSLFIEPQAGRGPILRAIDSARSEIRLGICNLSDRLIGDALAAAAARGVAVRVIVDQADYHAKPEEREELARLIGAGVSVHLSNPVFPQSFEKEMVIDRHTALVMTMCLVPETFVDTRDYGLVVSDPGVIREIASVFDTDWAYSAPPGEPTPPYNPTPPLHAPELIWGPPDATAKLARLIQSARRSIDATTELLDDPFLEGQLIAKAQGGVRVRLIAPLVPREGEPNAERLAFLEGQGVEVRVTTELAPPPGALPYMHAKTMVVDGRTAYLGSIDLDTTEAGQDRELGILFRQRIPVRRLEAQFRSDWGKAQPLPG